MALRLILFLKNTLCTEFGSFFHLDKFMALTKINSDNTFYCPMKTGTVLYRSPD